jgi:hypothetical protein
MRTNQTMEHRVHPSRRLIPACLLASLLFAVPTARAVTVSTVPADTTVDRGSTFVLRIMISSISDLKAFQVISTFDPAFIELQSVDAGEVLTAAGGAFFGQTLSDYVAPADTVWYDAAMLEGTTSGPGVLVYLTFKAIGKGTSPVPCWADLRDAGNHRIVPVSEGGMLHVQEPVPVSASTWGRLKALYR